MRCDVKLSGGEVIDGTGAGAFRADVAVAGDTVVAVGDLTGVESAREIDCTGKTVTPGFIDIHSHADWLLVEQDHGALVEPFVRQGMTSLVGGNCGFSPAPLCDRNRESVVDAGRLLADERLRPRWSTSAELLDELERVGPALNIAQLVGHGTVRSAVKGALDPSPPSAEELRQMEGLVVEALDAGCVGVSTGLGYAPGIFSELAELTACAKWAAGRDKLFTSHLKAYSRVSGVYPMDGSEVPHNVRALDEILEVAEAAAVRLQISHLIFVGATTWDTHEEVLQKIERAEGAGLDVAFDAFPYTAGNTTATVIFPPEVLPRLEEILQSPEEMEGLKAFAAMAFDAIGFCLDDIQILDANAPAFERYNGMFVDEAARRAGMDIWDFYARLVIESRRNARVLLHRYSGAADDERALRAVMAHRLCTIETDTLLTSSGHQNPASYGTFPRVLSKYVAEGLFTLPEAVHKMTGAPATRLGWSDRGRVGVGAAADLVVLDLGALEDRTTFAEPAVTPGGIEHVFINGAHVLNGDKYQTQPAGRVLRG